MLLPFFELFSVQRLSRVLFSSLLVWFELGYVRLFEHLIKVYYVWVGEMIHTCCDNGDEDSDGR